MGISQAKAQKRHSRQREEHGNSEYKLSQCELILVVSVDGKRMSIEMVQKIRSEIWFGASK